MCHQHVHSVEISSRGYSTPLQAKCREIRDAASAVINKADAREAELNQLMAHVNFHDDIGDLDEWLREKNVAVQCVKKGNSMASSSVGSGSVEILRLIRTKIKKLGDIDAELAANTEAIDGLRDRASKLPQVNDASNFAEPTRLVEELSGGVAALRDEIRDELENLTGQEAAAQFNNEADQMIKAVTVAPQLSAFPGEDMNEVAQSAVPQNLAEAIAAVNDAQVC